MKKKSWLAAWMPRVGISVALAAILAIYVVMLAPRSSGRSYETQVGDQQQVTLDDGTTLTLNTNTRVRVQYSAERRKILLDRGEILLSVAHDASRPLEVIAAGVVSRAVGTKFSVRLHEDASVETVVTEGRVLVLGQRNVLGMPMEPKPLAPTLVAGEHAVVNAKSTQVSHLTAQEMKGLLMWTTGRIVFQREKLSTVVRELNRYNVRQLTIRDARISETRIGGGFETSHADAYAQDLTIFFGNTALASQQPAPER
ncbi:MAG: FecR domain-containing protein [Gammaproteobacteria bacterium]